MSIENWLDICTNDTDTKKLKIKETKTIEDDFGNLTHLSTATYGDDIRILKGVTISSNTSKKTAVDVMRKEGFNNSEIANTLGISPSRVSQLANSKKKIK